MVVTVVLSIVFPVCFVVLLIGCLDCLIRRKRLQAFRNRDTTDGQQNTFSVDICDVPNVSEPVTIEPLPDIISKVAPLLRPQITIAERGKLESTLPIVNIQRPFPRDHLTYLNEIGSGWFGKVIESEATQIVGGSYKSHVVVKMLKDDASKLEQKQFLDEVNAFKNLEDRNLISVLGQCMETVPFLVILEFAAYGNLKSYLVQNSQDIDEMIANNRFISFALNAASGLACLHKHDYIHNDLAARNCLVMSDYTLKIGDYGISDHLFKNEYYNTGSQLLPIRWMAPETLIRADGVWTTKSYGKSSDMWSFGILLWEICSLGVLPYSMLTDEAVLQGVVLDKLLLPSDEDLKIPYKDRMWSIIVQCWQKPSDRLDVEQACNSLEQLSRITLDNIDTMSDFDQKWNQLKQNQNRISGTDMGSTKALAGSFIIDGSSSPSDNSSPHDDSEILDGTKSDDLMIEVGVDSNYINRNQDENIQSVSIDIHTNTNPSLGTFQHDNILDNSKHQHQVIVHVENELTRPSASPSHQVPAKSPEQSLVMTTTPDLQGQSSTSHSHLTDSSASSEYKTTNETLVPSSHQVEDTKDVSSINKDFSLQDLSDDNPQRPVKDSSAASKFDSVLHAEDDDFSEYVRTSPTAPSVDFTDFAFAVTDLSVKDKLNDDLKAENSSSLEITNVKSTVEENVVEESFFSDFEVAIDDNSKADNDSNSFSDFVISAPPSSSEGVTVSAAELITPVSNNADAASTQSLTDKDILFSLNSGLLDSDMSLIDPKSISQNENISIPLPEIDSKAHGELKDFVHESETRSGAEDMSLEEISVEKVVPDQNQNIFSSEQIPSNMSSLDSDASYLFDHLHLGTTSETLSLQSEHLSAFADLQKISVDTKSLEPIHAQLPAVTDVLEESNSEIFHALEANSGAFSSAEFLDLKLPSDLAESTDPTSIDDDAKT